MDLQSDQPIRVHTQDRLGRTRFASSVAKRILSYAPSDGLVLGLAGPWGSGKSSLLNLIEEALRGADEPPLVVRFTPWRYDDDSALLTNFFSLLGRTLKKSNKSKGVKKAAALLQRTGDVLNLGKPLDLLLPGVGTAIASAGKPPSRQPKRWTNARKPWEASTPCTMKWPSFCAKSTSGLLCSLTRSTGSNRRKSARSSGS